MEKAIYTQQHVKDLKQFFAEKIKQTSNRLTSQQLLQQLKPEIEKMRDKGLCFEEIVQFFADKEIVMKKSNIKECLKKK